MNPTYKFTPKTPRREKTTLLTVNGNNIEKKNSVHVFCRIRPLSQPNDVSCIKLLSPTVLELSTAQELRRKGLQCNFKHIFTSYATQNEVFDHVAYPLLEDLLNGTNGLLFTYGVTGSGKTFTLTGEQNNPGIMPKCIYTIFNTIGENQAPKFIIKSDRMNGFEIQSEHDAKLDELNEARSTKISKNKKLNSNKVLYCNNGSKIVNFNQNCLYSVFVNYIEIYNNSVFDLLDESTGRSLQSKILREDQYKNMYVNGVTEVEVKSAEEAFEMFNLGQKRKRMGNTILNSVSSRSHSIFNIRVVQCEQNQSVIPDSNQIKFAQLSLVDLAGSERTNRTQNTGQLLKEASKINNSLLTLRTCLDILRENQLNGTSKLVPYRDSRLTHLFKNYFENEGRVVMIVCVNPSINDFEENLQVMKFAESTQDVKTGKGDTMYTPLKKTIQKRIATPSSALKKVSSMYSFGPEIKRVHLNIDNRNECLISLDKHANILKLRLQKQTNFEDETAPKEQHFRKRLINMHQTYLTNRSEMRSAQGLLKKEKMRSNNFENKLSNMEMLNCNLNLKIDELQNVVRSLNNKLDEKDLKINRNILEKEKAKQQTALLSEKMTHELDVKLRRQREHLQAAAKDKEIRLQRVRQLLDDELPPEFAPSQIDMEIENKQPQEIQTPKCTRSTRRPQIPSSTPRHRRSRSVGEIWLEHNSVKPVPLGTVLQPAMKKRKSVTKLNKATDITNPKQSKYCLIAQEQDTDGEVETKLYKGDIVPTCGGGAQVIFNDVERLRQESPTKGSTEK